MNTPATPPPRLASRPGSAVARTVPGSVLTGLVVAVPVLVTLVGLVFAGAADPGGTPSAPPGSGHPLGTDVLGRDVLDLVLRGGLSVLGMTSATLVLAYAVGVPLGLLAAHSRRWADETVMRGLDLLLAFPSLLLLMTLAATGHRGTGTLVTAAAVVQLPAVTRLVRTAALAPGCRAAVEALRMQGVPEWRVQGGYVARRAVGPLVTDAGSRFGLVLYLLASANFLGLGLPPDSADWAVVVERNTDALFLQPAAVLVPAGLLMTLCVGGNLAADRFLARQGRRGR